MLLVAFSLLLLIFFSVFNFQIRRSPYSIIFLFYSQQAQHSENLNKQQEVPTAGE